jgi:hypothetical protein
MTSSRCASIMAGVLVTLAIAVPASAQGKSGQSHGKKGPAAPPPTTTTLPAASAGDATTTAIGVPSATPTAPFAWMDDANLMAPGTVWVGVSMVQWRGGGTSEVVVPVFDGSIGLTPRLQLGASVSRAGGGLGTTFVNAKISVFKSDVRGVKLAVSPTLEILNQAAMQWAPAGRSRTQWGLPVSVEINREAGRLYASSGYFSPGVWYAGAGVGRSLSSRVGVSMSFSHAWTTPETSETPDISGPRRNDLSGGASFEVTPNIAVFGSVGRTLATAAENGAGTTISFGLSLTAAPVLFKK